MPHYIKIVIRNMTQTIVYTSRVTLPAGADPNAKPVWLESLAVEASVKNKLRNISGVLSYKEGRIIQLIEGDSTSVERLYATISDDTRHQDVHILFKIEDSQRMFLDWGMVLEANIQSSSSFRDFLYVHFDHLVEMTENQSNELLFFIDHVFHEIVEERTKQYLN